jgi:hypothetical protein
VRIAILGMGAIGHVVARALDGRADIVKVDRTNAPLRDGEAPVDAAIVTTKTPGTAWAAEIAAKILAPDCHEAMSRDPRDAAATAPTQTATPMTAPRLAWLPVRLRTSKRCTSAMGTRRYRPSLV